VPVYPLLAIKGVGTFVQGVPDLHLVWVKAKYTKYNPSARTLRFVVIDSVGTVYFKSVQDIDVSFPVGQTTELESTMDLVDVRLLDPVAMEFLNRYPVNGSRAIELDPSCRHVLLIKGGDGSVVRVSHGGGTLEVLLKDLDGDGVAWSGVVAKTDIYDRAVVVEGENIEVIVLKIREEITVPSGFSGRIAFVEMPEPATPKVFHYMGTCFALRAVLETYVEEMIGYEIGWETYTEGWIIGDYKYDSEIRIVGGLYVDPAAVGDYRYASTIRTAGGGYRDPDAFGDYRYAATIRLAGYLHQ